MGKPGLHLSFATGSVQFAGACPTPALAAQTLGAMVREIERFQRAYAEGIRTQDAYRLWAAAEEAPPRLT